MQIDTVQIDTTFVHGSIRHRLVTYRSLAHRSSRHKKMCPSECHSSPIKFPPVPVILKYSQCFKCCWMYTFLNILIIFFCIFKLRLLLFFCKVFKRFLIPNSIGYISSLLLALFGFLLDVLLLFFLYGSIIFAFMRWWSLLHTALLYTLTSCTCTLVFFFQDYIIYDNFLVLVFCIQINLSICAARNYSRSSNCFIWLL